MGRPGDRPGLIQPEGGALPVAVAVPNARVARSLEAGLRQFPDGIPRASLAWRCIFFWTALVIFSFSGLTIGSVQGKYFQVERLSPQNFKITPRVHGPVSAYLLGSKGSQELITRQENGQTIILVRVPQGAKLTVKVGEYYLYLWMKNASSFEVQEEFRPKKASPAGEEHL
jgi:hypothetical protein